MKTLLAVLVCALAVVSAATASPPPRLPNQSAAGKVLATRFFSLLEHKDKAGLQAFLAPNFQVQRADGTADGKKGYLQKLPTIKSFRLIRFVVSYANGTLVVRYLAKATGIVAGHRYTPGWAPRLSVFTWNGARWQIVAHSNFNPLTG
jgi:hypothetical protein